MSEKIQLGSLSLDTNQLETKLDATIKQIRDLDKAIFENQESLNDVTKQYNEAKKALETLEKAGKSNTEEYRSAQRELAKLGQRVIEQRGDLRDLTSTLTEARNENKKYESALKELQRANQLLTDGYTTQSKSIEELNDDRKLLIQLAERERSVNGELSESHKKLNAYLDENAKAMTAMKANSEKSGFDSLSENANQFSESLGGVRDGLGQMASGNITGGLNQMKGAFTALIQSSLAFLSTPIGAAIAALAGIVVATKALYDYNVEMAKSSELVKQFTGLSGENLENLTVKVKTFAEQTGEDLKEVTRTVNSYAQAFGLSYDEAFEKVRNGYIKVGKSAEDFFDNTDEYAVQFNKAGFSADEFFSIMQAGTQDGVYKDKLTDAIKELDIRLKDISKAGREALENAFGKGFTDNLINGINNGSITTKKALQLISDESKKVGLNQQQLQKLTAELFSSMGEDGAGFVKVLGSIEKGLENATKGLDPFQQKTAEAMEATEEFHQAFADLFNMTGGGFESMMADIKTVFFQLLTKAIKVVIDLTNGFIDTYNQSLGLRLVIGSIGNAIKTNITIGIAALKLLWNSLKSTGNLLKAVLTLDADGIKQAYADGFNGIVDIVSDATTKIKDDFNSTLDQIKNGQLKKIEMNSSITTTNTTVNDEITSSKDSPTVGNNSKALADAKKLAEEKAKILEAEVALRLKYMQELAQLQSQYAAQELANQIANSDSLLEDKKRLTQQLVDEEKARLDQVNALQKQQLQTELDAKLQAIANEETAEKNRLQKLVDAGKLNDEQRQLTLDAFLQTTQAKRDIANQDYLQKELEFMLALDEAKKEVQLEIDEQDYEDAQLKKELELEAMYIAMEEDSWNRYDYQKQINDQIYDIEKSNLEKERADGLISEANYQLALANLNKRNAQNEKILREETNKHNLQGISSTLSTAKGLFKENSLAYKAIAIGEATINTYLSATSALKDFPGPVGIAMAAVNIAAGLASVAKIAGVGFFSGGANQKHGIAPEGYTGDGSTYSRAGYLPVHGGEVVFSRADVQALGGVAGVESLRPTSNSFNQNAMTDNSQLYEIVANAVREGSYAGTQSGTSEGIKQNNINQKISNNAKY